MQKLLSSSVSQTAKLSRVFTSTRSFQYVYNRTLLYSTCKRDYAKKRIKKRKIKRSYLDRVEFEHGDPGFTIINMDKKPIVPKSTKKMEKPLSNKAIRKKLSRITMQDLKEDPEFIKWYENVRREYRNKKEIIEMVDKPKNLKSEEELRQFFDEHIALLENYETVAKDALKIGGLVGEEKELYQEVEELEKARQEREEMVMSDERFKERVFKYELPQPGTREQLVLEVNEERYNAIVNGLDPDIEVWKKKGFSVKPIKIKKVQQMLTGKHKIVVTRKKGNNASLQNTDYERQQVQKEIEERIREMKRKEEEERLMQEEMKRREEEERLKQEELKQEELKNEELKQEELKKEELKKEKIDSEEVEEVKEAKMEEEEEETTYKFSDDDVLNAANQLIEQREEKSVQMTEKEQIEVETMMIMLQQAIIDDPFRAPEILEKNGLTPEIFREFGIRLPRKTVEENPKLLEWLDYDPFDPEEAKYEPPKLTLEERMMIAAEYEAATGIELPEGKRRLAPDDELAPYELLTSEQRFVKLIHDWPRTTDGNIRLPKDLEEKVDVLIHAYDKSVIKRAAQQLSTIFRLRTGGFGHEFKFDEVPDPLERLQPRTTGDLRKEHEELIKNLKEFKEAGGEIGKRSVEQQRQKYPKIVYKEVDAVAYAAHRLPAVYSTSSKIFAEISKRLPDWDPKSMLDFGTGPGTTIFTAHETWEGSIKEILAVEPSSAMMDVATKLLEGIDGIIWRRFLNENIDRKYDLVTASYVLNELSTSQERIRVAKTLWKLCDGVLVFIEPGTPLGFQMIKEIRSAILAEATDDEPNNPTVLAPCPHDKVCPMRGTDWCHFSSRSERVRFQRITKDNIKLGYEDEKYSYVVFRKKSLTGLDPIDVLRQKELAILEEKGEDPNSYRERIRREVQGYARKFAMESHKWPRIIGNPKKRTGHVIMTFCTPFGTLQETIYSRKDGKMGGYRFARKARWGDQFPFRLKKPKHLQQLGGLEQMSLEGDVEQLKLEEPEEIQLNKA